MTLSAFVSWPVRIMVVGVVVAIAIALGAGRRHIVLVLGEPSGRSAAGDAVELGRRRFDPGCPWCAAETWDVLVTTPPGQRRVITAVIER